MTLLIKNGHILDPQTQTDSVLDLLISDGKIAQIAKSIKTPADRVIDATGLFVTPGLIDVHVHCRQPGDEEEETIASGAAAAVAGGFTTIVCMPNTKPALDNEAQVEFVLRESQRVGLANVLPCGAITKSREGKELAELALMQKRGAVAFSDDGIGVGDPAVMRKALQYAKMLDTVLMQHCEEPTLAGGAMHAGLVSVSLGLSGIPAEAEQLMIARDCILNKPIGCRYHVQHISTAYSVELVRQYRKMGMPVTAEASPHHLLLTDDCCRTYDTNFKMNPPLRGPADVQAVIDGVKDGTITLLATDHAPHLAEEKELEFAYAPNGILGLETAVGLYAKALVEPGHISWLKLIELMTLNPAKMLKIHGGQKESRGSLEIGAIADITLIDPNKEWTVDSETFESKSRNTPFNGWKLKARAVKTIVGGVVRWEDGLR